MAVCLPAPLSPPGRPFLAQKQKPPWANPTKVSGPDNSRMGRKRVYCAPGGDTVNPRETVLQGGLGEQVTRLPLTELHTRLCQTPGCCFQSLI